MRHVGLKIDFHHPDSDELRLTARIEDLYSLDKDLARIFVEGGTGNLLSARDLLEGYFAGSAKSLIQHLPGEHLPEPGRSVHVTFPLLFDDGRLSMMTDQGGVYIKAVKIAVEVTANKENG